MKKTIGIQLSDIDLERLNEIRDLLVPGTRLAVSATIRAAIVACHAKLKEGQK